MHLSIIILSWNSRQYLTKCLNAILATADINQHNYEVMIVDNGSSDGSVELLQTFKASHPDIIKPILLEHNTGTTYSRNLALQQACGDYILIMDSDVVLNDSTFSQLKSVLNADTSIGMACPKLIYGSGAIQKSTDQFPTLWRKLHRYFCLKSIEQREADIPAPTQPIVVDYAISAFWLMRKHIVEQVGMLDENIFYAPEDVDYCLRIWQRGYKIVYVPNVWAIHYAQEISRGFKINQATIEHIKGLIYYFKKHRYFFRRPRFSSADSG